MTEILRGILGLTVFLAAAWALSEQRQAFPWRRVALAVACQVALALLMVGLPVVARFFGAIAHGVDHVQAASEAGARFVFGYLSGGPQPFEPAVASGASSVVFAFRSLPAIVFVSALSALLWHWGVLRAFVRAAAWLLGRLFGVSGPIGVSTSACVFVGMIEAPLLIRPVVPLLSRGELFTLMVDGMSVLAGSMMILLGGMLEGRVPGAFSHLLMAAVISTPMAIVLAQAVIPVPPDAASRPPPLENPYVSSLDALAHGTLVSVRLAANIVAMVIVSVGLVALLDQMLLLLPTQTPWTLASIFGLLLSPVAWLMGIPFPDLQVAGSLLGTKVALNEIVAYGQFAALAPGTLTDKGSLIVTYALASFGNFGSVAILMGALSALAPDRGREIVALGFRALLVALLVTCLTGTTVGILHTLLH